MEIDLDFFARNYPDQPIKMTVSQETLPNLAEGVIYLHEKGFEVSCNLAYNIDWSKDNNKLILEEQLHILIDYYLEHPEITPCSMLDMGIETVAPGDNRFFRFCGCGITVVAYDVDGTSYPCQMFMPLSCGLEKAECSLKIEFYPDRIPDDLMDDKCRKCVIQPSCPTCYGANYIKYGDIYIHDDNYCKLYKIIIKARSFFRAQQWNMKQMHMTEAEERALLTNIIRIQSYI